MFCEIKMKKNIKLNYLFTGLMNFNPVSALWVVYMASKGLSLGQIGIAEALLHVTVFTMEVPTGIVADLFGRRISRMIGSALWLLSTVLMVFSNTFIGFCLAFIITGLAITMESGAGEALVYDSLKAINCQDAYQKVAGRIAAIINICNAVSILLGGLLSDIRFLYAYLVSAAIQFAATVVSILFSEPPICAEGKEKESFFGQVRSCFRLVRENGRILFIVVLSGILDMSACLIYFYGRKLFGDIGYTQGGTGFIYMLYNLSGALAGYGIHRLDKRFGEKRLVAAICLILTLGFGSFAFSPGFVPIAAFILVGFVYGATYPLFSDYINKEIPSEYRATILSLNGAMFSFSMIVFFPLVGMLGDITGLAAAFRIVFVPLAVIMMGLGFISLKRRAVANISA